MLRRFSSGMNPPECKKRLHENATALTSTFRRVNLSLAGCSSAEPASVSVQNKIQSVKLYLQLVEKARHLHFNNNILNPKRKKKAQAITCANIKDTGILFD